MSHLKDVRRRQFLEAVAAGAALVGIGGCGKAAGNGPGVKKTPGRPNILVIMSDEHDPAVTGCYGNRLVRTPPGKKRKKNA